MVRVVLEVPSTRRWRRFRRGSAVWVAGLLIALSALLLTCGVFMSLFLLDPQGENATPTNYIAAATMLVAQLICLLVGIRLLRGKRRIALFLRRFGLTEATHTVSAAIAGKAGRSWRLVTLDDAEVAPVGVATSPRRALAIGCLTSLAVVAAAAIFAAVIVTQSGDGLEGIGAALLVALFVVPFLLLLLIVIAAFSTGALVQSVRGQRARKHQIRTSQDVADVARSIARRGSKVFAPRLVVVAVPTPLWRQAVYELASVTKAAVIDISQPSESLLWELENLRPAFGSRCILVGRWQAVAAWALAADVPPVQSLHGRLARMLESDEVIAYGDDDPARRMFSHALRAKLEVLA